MKIRGLIISKGEEEERFGERIEGIPKVSVIFYFLDLMMGVQGFVLLYSLNRAFKIASKKIKMSSI